MARSLTMPASTPRPWEWLYDLVGLGMWTFTHTRFAVEVTGAPIPAVAPGQLWLVTHRAETDVPLIGGLLTTRGGMWRRRQGSRVHFAARDDLFMPGVVGAGLALPPVLARAASPLTPGPWLRRVRAHPVRRPTGLKLSQAVGGLAGATPLADVVGRRVLDLLAAEAAGHGRTPPSTVGELRRGMWARAAWADVTAADLDSAAGQAVWRAHITRTAADVRRLIALLRDGEPLVLFPEGRVSPDGGIGPIGEILDVIARRGAPRAILPVGISYDPLRRGRTIVAVAVGAPIPATDGALAATALAHLRGTMPVTVGQVVSREVTAAVAAGRSVVDTRQLLEAMAQTNASAVREGRPVTRGLGSAGRRARALGAAMGSLASRGLVEPRAAGGWSLDVAALVADPVVARLAAEDRAVWS